ncbi:MAG: hypothetical protein AAF557_17970 [Pseudomonadota bacterium]
MSLFIQKIKLALLALCFAALLAPEVSYACSPRTFDISRISKANLVIKGRLLSFEYVTEGASHARDHFAHVKLQTLKTMKGEQRETWDIYLWGYGLSAPQKWMYGDEVVVGAVWSGAHHPPFSKPVGIGPTLDPYQAMQVYGQSCAGYFIFPTGLTPAMERGLEKIAEKYSEVPDGFVAGEASDQDGTRKTPRPNLQHPLSDRVGSWA